MSGESASSKEPISGIEWVQVDGLVPNAWNPNMVLTPELKVLEANLVEFGWLQPVLINRNRVVIDGFHRIQLVRLSPMVRQRRGDRVPVVTLDIPDADAMILTVRMNRARGVHAAPRMSSLVRELIDVHGYERASLAKKLGATRGEIDLLYKDIFGFRDLKHYAYSQAWVPQTVDASIDEATGEWFRVGSHEAAE